MQFDRDASGKLTPLPKPSIDAGESSLTAVLQGVISNYDTDLLTPLIKVDRWVWEGRRASLARTAEGGCPYKMRFVTGEFDSLSC